ncbi:SAM-dependent methyltransferase [Actibacterium pelagium]|uniref:SAM-dependent methyltransferase n=1 Tax=Actibacterium pelagium TaxID=2029103 RepID=A0A917AG28_9RHOB|nr:class I SAM-dependent methyltransferase [Actibacterium pelagium]GGE45943.1 SAM-dependent methyltransferase [Actibacterium pelagium]
MWEERFSATEEFVFGTEPARFMTEHSQHFTPGATALSVADGEGRNSVWMAQQGLPVTALEYAPSAISKARTLAEARGVAVDFREADVLAYDWSEQFDLVVGVFFQFVGPEGRKVIFDGMKQAVRPGGLILIHGYTPKQVDYGTGGPSNPANMYTEDLLAEEFAGWDIIENRAYEHEIQEGKGHSGMSALIDFVAQKPLP